MKVKRLDEDLEESQTARRKLKITIDELTEHKIMIEEQLYETKTRLLDLINQIEILEESNRGLLE